MKLEINTEEKKIKLTETVNLGELFTFLEEFLPDLKWREYSIEVNVVNNWVNPITPITVPTYPYPAYPSDPNYPWITYSTSTDNVK